MDVQIKDLNTRWRSVVHTDTGDCSSDFPPDMLFLIPYNPILQAREQHNFILLFFFLFWCRFQAQRSVVYLPYYVSPCHQILVHGRLNHDFKMLIVFSRHIYQQLLIRTLELARSTCFMNHVQTLAWDDFHTWICAGFYACLINEV